MYALDQLAFGGPGTRVTGGRRTPSPASVLPTLGERTLSDEETDTVWCEAAGFLKAAADEVAELQFVSDLRELSTEFGSFILFSRHRRKLDEREL